jgi:hypothetical protein
MALAVVTALLLRTAARIGVFVTYLAMAPPMAVSTREVPVRAAECQTNLLQLAVLTV